MRLQIAVAGAALFVTGSSLRAETDGWRPQIKASPTAEAPAAQPTRSVAPTPIDKAKRSPPAADRGLQTGATPDAPTAPPAPTTVASPTSSAASQDKEATGQVGAGAPQVAEPLVAEGPTKKEDLAEGYCKVAVDAVVAAKLQEEEAKANAVKAEIEAKLDELKKATAELQKWLERREEFKTKATDNLVTVYTQMDPEAAAQRLTLVGEPTAAAIIMKLPPKNASAVLGEMQPEMAGKITAFMAGAAAVKPKSDGQAGATQ